MQRRIGFERQGLQCLGHSNDICSKKKKATFETVIPTTTTCNGFAMVPHSCEEREQLGRRLLQKCQADHSYSKPIWSICIFIYMDQYLVCAGRTFTIIIGYDVVTRDRIRILYGGGHQKSCTDSVSALSPLSEGSPGARTIELCSGRDLGILGTVSEHDQGFEPQIWSGIGASPKYF